MNRLSPLAIVALVVLFFVLAFGSLYAYRSQTPAVQTVPITQAVSDIQQGHVREVVYEGNRATLSFDDGRREHTNTPAGPFGPGREDPLTAAVSLFNQQNPTRPITLRSESAGPEFGPPLLAFLVAFLPLLFLLLLVILGARIIAASRAPDPYERLERIANLRDRGVLSEEEFQREKRRLLK
jgi:ATP-dependent Zn protease